MNPQELEQYFYDQLSTLESKDLVHGAKIRFDRYFNQDLHISAPLRSAVERRYNEVGVGVKTNYVTLEIQSDFNSLVFDSFPLHVRLKSQKYTETDGTRSYYPLTGTSLAFIEGPLTKASSVSIQSIDISNSHVKHIDIQTNVEKLDGFGTAFEKMTIFRPGSFAKEKSVKSINLLGKLGNIDLSNCASDTIVLKTTPNQPPSNENPKSVKISTSKVKSFEYHLTDEASLEIDGGSIESCRIKVMNSADTVTLKNVQSKDIEIIFPFPPSRLKQLVLRDILHTDELKIKTLLGNEDFGMRSFIERLIFRNVLIKKDSVWEVKNFNGITSLLLIDILNKGELIFRNISFYLPKPEGMSVDKVFDAIESIFAESNPEEELKSKAGIFLLGSRLGNTSFINSDLPGTLNVYEVDISGLKLTNTGFPKKVEALRYRNRSRNKLEALQQLRKNADGYGDKDTAAIYRSAELDIRLNQITSSLRSLFFNLDEVLSLLLNKVTNNHGQNWLRTVVIIFIYGYISYGIFLSKLGFNVTLGVDGINLINSQIGHFLDFLVPGFLSASKNKIDLLASSLGVTKDQINAGMPKLILLFNDIIALPFLIFQLVSAFRKHVVK